MRILLEERLSDALAPEASAAASVAMAQTSAGEAGRYYSQKSIETLVVVLAVITIVAVFAGMVARLCGGRHLSSREHDVEGWVERKCRSCIDGGVTAVPPPAPAPPAAAEEPAKPAPEAKPAAEESKK
ncbi:unnamed protein product [Linum tenue]|uniref:Uncharacterized protein n=1 Tax=Linum tenue TaxID=586396 RepID=A0AAV0GWE3_9ROSI|nr:unnamed protein product [Linum tenue]